MALDTEIPGSEGQLTPENGPLEAPLKPPTQAELREERVRAACAQFGIPYNPPVAPKRKQGRPRLLDEERTAYIRAANEYEKSWWRRTGKAEQDIIAGYLRNHERVVADPIEYIEGNEGEIL